MSAYKKFIDETYMGKLDDVTLTQAMVDAINESAATIQDACGEIGRGVLSGKSVSEIAEESRVTKQRIYQLYGKFRRNMRHISRSRRVFEAAGLIKRRKED